MKSDVDIEAFKTRLEEEKVHLEKELKRIGRINPSNPADWEAKAPLENIEDHADPNVVADRIEAYEENSAALKELEIRFNNINLALNKIEKNTYGICEISGKEIELDRLEANPAARTCKEHLGELED